MDHVLAFERASDTAVAHIHTALRCVQSAIELDPSSAEETAVWGIVNHYLGEQERALERLEEATRLAPADAESHRRLADLYLVSGQSDDALLAAEAAFALDPFNVASYTVAGRVRDYRGQFGDDGQTEQMNEFQSAAQYYDGGARFAADRSIYLSEHNADVLVSLQQHDRAIEILTDRVARARNSYIDYYRLGRTLQSAGKPIPRWQEVFRRSRELLAERLGAEPGNGVLWSWQALVHTRLGEAKEAAQATERATTLAPDNLEVLYNTARLYTIQRGKGESAGISQEGHRQTSCPGAGSRHGLLQSPAGP